MMQKRASQILVGDLLVKSELVSLPQLADAMPVALKTGVPVGRVLIASAFLSEEKFKQALSLQSLVRDHLISEEDAVAALKLVASDSIDLNAALKKLGIESEFFDHANKLGEILISAGAIDKAVLEQALNASYTTGLQLARVLALRGLVREQTAFVALVSQSLLRDQLLTREQALNAIQTVMAAKSDNGKSASNRGVLIAATMTARKSSSMRLGELLLLSGLVIQSDLLSALDKGISEEVPLGRMLVRMKLLSDVELNQALTLHDMISKGTVAAQDAIYVLARVKASAVSLSKALSQAEQYKNETAQVLSFAEFLLACGLLSEAVLNDCKKEAIEKEKPLDDLVEASMLFEHSFTAFAKQTYFYFKSKRLNDEQCAFVLQLRLAGKKNEDLDEVLITFKW